MQLFYVPQITKNEIVLDETESKHAIRVLRLNAGDKIQIVDGKGGFYTAEITEPHPKKCKLSVTESFREYGKRNFSLHIAIAPTKNIDRIEWFLEKATEIGIDEITPLLCERSERKSVKPERLEKVLISAMKQSVKAYLPKLNPLISFKEFICKDELGDRYIAHCNQTGLPHLKNEIKIGTSIVVLIGPEGDFSPEEVEIAREQGFCEISLGNSRLRTETAGVVACHIVNLAND
ncbi:MAG TPA: 16S rRNA (uracil(1498)-N(3))-methyltransferase [Mariniphaga anaerophila]|uniref:Ribosomal RNA small subunit methyltransferase E n=1 Tax=Mariniphaga anaerophila TaxID=1484053 RepID=A0A831LN18_9BACT|nr:16S rRNA (uracil(1498)-N(3))-methyltransferase [Mariniphaga anaerophila]